MSLVEYGRTYINNLKLYKIPFLRIIHELLSAAPNQYTRNLVPSVVANYFIWLKTE